MIPKLYCVNAAPLCDERLYAAAYAMAGPERQRRADAFRFPKDRRLCLGARLLLSHAIREAGLSLGEPVVGEYGKPAYPGSGFFFNLSHSGDWVLCAAAGCEIGCDVERISDADLSVARRFFAPGEYSAIMAAPEAERNALFYRFWTLKESFLKATGYGLHLPLNRFEIGLGETIIVRQSVDARDYRFREFGGLEGCRCAVCAVGEDPPSALTFTDLRALLGE